jgi:glycosyltransferase involved in cell wall biosynthesis
VTGFVNPYRLLDWLPDTVSLVWTLHDMNPFTGGCHYSAGCTRYAESCGCCPILGSHRAHDLSSRILRMKRGGVRRRARRGGSTAIVAPSRWMRDRALQSSVFAGLPVHHIPNPIDPRELRPVGRTIARRALGLPADRPVIVFVAHRVDDERKGAAHLRRALAQLGDLRPVALTVGEPPCHLAVETVNLGAVSSPRLLGLAYSAADVFVTPALEDNYPNTVLEAMVCSRPVVAFAVGGLPEMIDHGSTGLLVRPGDTEALAEALRRLLGSPQEATEMGVAAERRVRQSSAPRVVGEAYRRLYEAVQQSPGAFPYECWTEESEPDLATRRLESLHRGFEHWPIPSL